MWVRMFTCCRVAAAMESEGGSAKGLDPEMDEEEELDAMGEQRKMRIES